MNFCSSGGHLVKNLFPIPSDITHYDVEFLPRLGCNQLGCPRCGAMVRNAPDLSLRGQKVKEADCAKLYDLPNLTECPQITPALGFRLYLCRCSSWVQMGNESELDDPDTHPFPPPPQVPWRCQGHPLVDLPHEFDGILVTADNIDRLLVDAMRGSVPAAARPVDHAGPAWTARMHVRMAGTRWAQAVDDIATSSLDDPEPVVRRNAIELLAMAPLPKGRRRIMEIFRRDPHAFDGLTDAAKLLKRIRAQAPPAAGADARSKHLERVIGSDGRQRWVRNAFRPEDYTVPPQELQRLKSYSQWQRGSLDELDLHDGAFCAYEFVRRYERDGKPFVVLRNALEWVIEVELTRGAMGEIVAVAPEEAWKLARERDLRDPTDPVLVRER